MGARVICHKPRLAVRLMDEIMVDYGGTVELGPQEMTISMPDWHTHYSYDRYSLEDALKDVLYQIKQREHIDD